MLRNIIFDFGGVLLDWNPHYLYDPYFGSSARAELFLTHICTYEWNQQHDLGKPIAEGTAELVAEFPEWRTEIEMYYGQFTKMIGGQVPGMYNLLQTLKDKGYRLYGLSNWSVETFAMVSDDPIFQFIENRVISGAIGIMKPDPRIFIHAISQFGVNPAETAFVDDNAINVQAATQQGLQGILFTTAEELAQQILK